MRHWLARLLDWVRRGRLDRELEEELRFHAAQLERDALADGDQPEEARYAARRRLGNLASLQERTRAEWSLPVIDDLVQHLRYAFRGIRRSPTFAATVVVTLALGLGANTAMFSVVDHLIFRPLPLLRDPDRVHRIYLQWFRRGEQVTASGMSYARFAQMREWTTSFTTVAGLYEGGRVAVGKGHEVTEHPIAAVTAEYFDLFAAPPVRGRYFTAAEDVPPGGSDVVVLSHAYWQSAFGGADVLGQSLDVGRVRFTIIGVAPPKLGGTNDAFPPVAFVPASTNARLLGITDADGFYREHRFAFLQVLVRRKDGVTVEQATADVHQAYVQTLEAERAAAPAGASPGGLEAPRALVADPREAAGPGGVPGAGLALWTMGVAAIVLLIACANVANLYLGRALSRSREFTVRLALGVSRARLAVQSVTEGLVLSLLGAGGGLVVAHWTGAAVRQLLIPGAALPEGGLLDWRILAFTTVIAVAVGVVTGAAPLLFVGRAGLASALKSGPRGGARRSPVRTGLLVVQAMFSVALLVGAALFVESLRAVRAEPLGFVSDPVLVVSHISRTATLDSARAAVVQRDLLAAAEAYPGVVGVSRVMSAPLWGTWRPRVILPDIPADQQPTDITTNAVDERYFDVIGTRLVRGRSLDERDRSGPTVALVSLTAARILYPDRDAIGQCLWVETDTLPCLEVVGIVEDVIQNDRQLGDAHRAQLYISRHPPYSQSGLGVLLLRLAGDPTQEAEVIRRALQRALPSDHYLRVEPLSGRLSRLQRPWQIGVTLFSAFSVLALVVAAVGLYGVISYDLAERRHELGVRVALGARRGHILRLVIGHGQRIALAGVALGLGTALVASRWLEPHLFKQSARDPLVYTAVGLLMLLVALGACLRPALRATKADPNSALRAE